MTTPQTAQQALCIMPREMRMMTERILSLTSLPKGFFLAVQDVAMFSQKLGLGGFALLEQRFDGLKDADPAHIRIIEEAGPKLRLDAGGQHAWFVAPSLVDLLGELVGRFGTAEVVVIDSIDPDELAVAAPLAARAGLKVELALGEARLTASAAPLTGDVSHDEPLLWDLLQHGARIEAELWWRIYHLAQKALAPDSIVSRRHAGPMIVNDDGTVIGRKDNDDETDIGFLASPTGGGMQTEGMQS